MNLLSQEIPEFLKSLPVRRIGNGLYISADDKPRCGPRAGLAPELIAQVKSMLDDGFLQIEIAVELGVAVSRVNRLVVKNGWSKRGNRKNGCAR